MKPKRKTSNSGADKQNDGKRSISISQLEEIASGSGYSKRSMSVEEAIEDLENQADSEYSKIDRRHEKAKESFKKNSTTVLSNRKAVALACSLFVVTGVALGFGNMMSQAAMASDSELLEAEYIDFGSGTSQSSDVLQELLAKKVAYTVVGKGHIEPYSNCTLDEDDLTISFTDNSADAQIRVVADSGYAPVIAAEKEIQSSNGVITLDNDVDYGILSITFIPEEEAKSRPSFEDADERTTISKVSFEGEDPVPPAGQLEASPASEVEAEPVYEEPVYEEPVYEEETYYEGPAEQETETTTTYTAPAVEQTAPPAAASAPAKSNPTTTPNSMTSDENAVAHEIFDAYNAYRASKGLSRVSWSDNCANMAYSSSMQCSARGSLAHRLGIPASSQNCFSDILQYSSWRMSGGEAVNAWKNSTGHRKQMQCPSATQAGVGVFYNSSNGRWYYTIVYDFSGTNVGGN